MNRPDIDDKGIFRPEPRDSGPTRRRPPRFYDGTADVSEATYEIGFDRDGNYTADAESACCKRVDRGQGKVAYYVKFSTAGHDVGHMMNPMGLYFRPDRVAVSEAKTGRARYMFKQVPETAFRDYLQFLHSKNERYLRSAERQVLDA